VTTADDERITDLERQVAEFAAQLELLQRRVRVDEAEVRAAEHIGERRGFERGLAARTRARSRTGTRPGHLHAVTGDDAG
jgi:hypothetical protein